MNIVYYCNNNYFSIMTVSIVSLLDNNKEVKDLSISIILLDECKIEQMMLRKVVERYGRVVDFIDGKIYCDRLRFWPKEKDSNYVPLLLAEILPFDKVLCIDCDTIVSDSLCDLWGIDITGYRLAAVQDIAAVAYKNDCGLSKDDPYFNMGTMLINLASWRDNHLIESFQIDYDYYISSTFGTDQRVLNKVCKGHIHPLHPKYDMLYHYCRYDKTQLSKLNGGEILYSDAVLHEAKRNPCIIHYAGQSCRPWTTTICVHPHKHFFYKYEQKSPIRVIYVKTSLKGMIRGIVRRYAPFPLYLFIYRMKRT